MNLERCIDSKLLSMNESPTRSGKTSSFGRQYEQNVFSPRLGDSRGSSLRSNMVKSNSISSNTNSSLVFSRSSSSNSYNLDESSRASSTESVYYDASSILPSDRTNKHNSIQICDSVPIASKLIDIIHYSISKDSSCTNSSLNFMARLVLGKTIERYPFMFPL